MMLPNSQQQTLGLLLLLSLGTNLSVAKLIANATIKADDNEFEAHANSYRESSAVQSNSTLWDEAIITSGDWIKKTLTGEILQNIMNKLPKAKVSGSCRRSMEDFQKGINGLSTWALRMADSSSKVPAGILDGSVIDFGAFHECLLARSKDFQGKYCIVGHSTPLVSTTKRDALDPYIRKYGQPPEFIASYLSDHFSLTENGTLWLATCLPSTCSEEDIMNMYTTAISGFGLDVRIMECQIDEPRTLTYHQKLALCFVLVILSFSVVGTIWDVCISPRPHDLTALENEGKFSHVLRVFSMRRRARLFQAECDRVRRLDFMHGLRFVPCLTFVGGHIYAYPDKYHHIRYSHFIKLHDLLIGPEILIFDNTVIMLAIFFFLSGFLLVYASWRKLEQNGGRINVISYLLRKILRMIPSFSFAVALAFIVPLMSRAPFWNTSWEHITSNCEKNISYNFLFTSNYYHITHQCLPHTWFLSCLMQCHVVALVVLLVTFRWRKMGVILALSITFGSALRDYFTTISLHLTPPSTFIMNDLKMMQHHILVMYTKLYSYVGSYFMGMLSAYIVLKSNNIQLSRFQKTLGWMFCFLTMYGAYWGLHLVGEFGVFPAVYNALYHTVFSMGLAWIAFACSTGNGGIVNRLLSARCLVLMSNLSFLIYLLHPIVYHYKAASVKERTYFGHAEHDYDWCATVIFSMALSYFVHILVEAPFNELDWMLIGSEIPPPKSKSHQEVENETAKKTE